MNREDERIDCRSALEKRTQRHAPEEELKQLQVGTSHTTTGSADTTGSSKQLQVTDTRGSVDTTGSLHSDMEQGSR